KPDYPQAYYNLGNALFDQRKLVEAEAAYRKAIELVPPDPARVYLDLGTVLCDQRKLPEAVDAFRKAIELKPDYPKAYYNLGVALFDQKKPAEAEDAFRKAIESKSHDAVVHAMAHCNLSWALAQQGRFAEALVAAKRGHELGAEVPDWPDTSAQLV